MHRGLTNLVFLEQADKIHLISAAFEIMKPNSVSQNIIWKQIKPIRYIKNPLSPSKCSQDECMEQRQVIYFLLNTRMAIQTSINFPLMELQSIGQIPRQRYQCIDTSVHCLDKSPGSSINLSIHVCLPIWGCVTNSCCHEYHNFICYFGV